MTPDAWKALPEAEKEQRRQQFRRERRQIYTGHGRRQHGDFQKGLIFWFAGDVYHLVKVATGMSLLLGALLGVALLLGGCADTAYWWQRTAFQIDCRPEHLQANGHCTPLTR